MTDQQPDPLAAALSSEALAALDDRIGRIVDQQFRQRLPTEIESARFGPWMDTKHAAAYLGITENALRLRVREGLVPAHRDAAGRLRFHRREFDQSMTTEPRRRHR
jgi:hypothetical protein